MNELPFGICTRPSPADFGGRSLAGGSGRDGDWGRVSARGRSRGDETQTDLVGQGGAGATGTGGRRHGGGRGDRGDRRPVAATGTGSRGGLSSRKGRRRRLSLWGRGRDDRTRSRAAELAGVNTKVWFI